eukprot:TRINITY_DN10470_c0_g1_i1.p1 TRINITY_DN10470_c0_g1~~TRINITY_DN10470_c0_g1_i1.p1  ORF type:complete len:903 (-),score=164.60 TRINITY_DN10470_c0_g1_i1:279-2702(-)
MEAADAAAGPASDAESLRARLQYELRVQYEGGGSDFVVWRDPFAFRELLPEASLQAWAAGQSPPESLASLFGAHHMQLRPGIWGTRFAVWAPHAQSVSVVGDWNCWDGRAHPMCKRERFGIWEVFIPVWDLRGHKYGYSILPANSDSHVIKADPFALEFVDPSNGGHDAKVPQSDDYSRAAWGGAYAWGDAEWLKHRADAFGPAKWASQPLSIYEVHLPTWGAGKGYRELAEPLAEYVQEMGFTAVEFMPLSQYPSETSWGYQCAAGLYAVDARLGTPDDFRFLVDTLHQKSIFVFIDFVGAHFAKDPWGLTQYSGAPQFEYEGSAGEIPGWGTARFDFSNPKVRSYLIGAADYWVDHLHVDGLRVDAVAAILYRNFGREEDGDAILAGRGVVNEEGVAFLRDFCKHMREVHPGVLLSAEESTNFKWTTQRDAEDDTERKSAPAQDLGFHLKWNLGFAYDVLAFMKAEFKARPHLETFGWKKMAWYLAYAFNERWVLPLSHDNVQPSSLLDQMTSPAEREVGAQFALLRALLAYMICVPGRPLLFMGAELGADAWSCKASIPWDALRTDLMRVGLRNWTKKLLGAYNTLPALHVQDDSKSSFEWLDKDSCGAPGRCVMAWRRRAEGAGDVVILLNFSPDSVASYKVSLGHAAVGPWKCIAHSDVKSSEDGTEPDEVVVEASGENGSVSVDLPGFSAMLFVRASPAATRLAFELRCELPAGCAVRVVGAPAELGAWSPEAGLTLERCSAEEARWRGSVEIAARGRVEFKYVIVRADKLFEWEEGFHGNRAVELGGAPVEVRSERFGQL